MIEVLKEIIFNKKWAISQLVNVAGLSVMKFLTLLLIVLNFTQAEVLLFFAAIFSIKFLFLYKMKEYYLNHERVITKIIGISVIVSFSSYLLLDSYELAKIFILFGALLLFIYNDLFIISGLTSLHFSIKDKSKELLIMATSGALVLFITSFFMPIIGYLSSVNQNYIIYSSILFVFFSLILYLNNTKEEKNTKIEKINKKIKIPNLVKWQISLSISMAILNNLGRNFMIPLFILLLAERHGFTQDAFKFLGILLGVVSLITVFSRMIKLENIHSQKLMLKSYTLCLITWILFALSFYCYDINLFNEFIILPIIFIMIILEEVVAKFWTSGYLGELKRNADNNSKNYKESEDNYKFYFYTHNNLSLIGTIIGFILSYLLFVLLDLNLTIIMVIFSVAALIVGFIFYIKHLKN